MFELNTEGMEQDGQEGVFLLHFPCDYTRILPTDRERAELARLGVPMNVSCEYCAPDNITPVDIRIDDGRPLHRIQLICVSDFLRNHPNREQYRGARELAEQDSEWLAYPMDYVHRLLGYSSRIPVARIWDAYRYTFVPA